MSALHLGAGSEKPAEVDGQARLYSMKFCPFAQRIRLILSLKEIPHDIVNINLENKPEWYLQVHPEGKVPAFVDADGTLVTDSIVIANYLEEKYPTLPLYNEETKARDVELIDHYSKFIGIFSNCIHGNDDRSLDEIVEEVSTLLVEYEEELKTRKTDFFGGEKPGMLDILMWPWVERAPSLSIIYQMPLIFQQIKFPYITAWMSNMCAQPFVQQNKCPYEKFAQLIQDKKAGNVDFDKI